MVDAEVVRTNLAEARAAVDEAAATAGRPAGSVAILAAVKYVTRDDLQAIAEAGVDAGRREPHRRADRQAGRLRRRLPLGLHRPPPEPQGARPGGPRRARPRAVGRVDRAPDRRALGAPAGRAGRGQHRRRPRQGGRLAGRAGSRSWSCSPASPNVRVRGLMTMPPFAEDPAASRPFFAQLRELAAASTRALDRHAHVRRALDGHQPGLRRGSGRGRDDRAPRQRALRRTSDAVTDPSSTLAPHGSS